MLFLKDNKNLNDNIKLLEFIVKWLEPFKNDINKIVEISCGNGKSYHFFQKN